MSRFVSFRWRKALFQVHLWMGVILGLYVLAISASGSILVFERELVDDTPRTAHEVDASIVNYDDIVAIAQRAHPEERIESIDLRTQRRRVIPVVLSGRSGARIVYVDSISKTILRDVLTEDAHPFMHFVLLLHTNLHAGRSGAVANGVGGASLFALGVSGVVLWWPGVKRWRRSLGVKWSANWKRVNREMHIVVGVWTALFVAMWGLTGAYFIWPQTVRDAFAKVSPMNHFRETASNWQPGEAVLRVGWFVAQARQRYPQSQVAYVYQDLDRQGGVVKVFLSRDPSRPLTLMEDVVTYQPATGEVLSDLSTSNLTAAERVSLALYSVHFGDFGGVAGKIVWCALGIVPALLVVTGFLMWWNRVLKKKAQMGLRRFRTT